MLLVVTRRPSIRPMNEHGFMVPLIAGDFVNNASIASHSGPSKGWRFVTVSDVLKNHVTDFGGALFSVATWPHIYIISEVGGKVKNFLGFQEIFFPHRIENFHPSTIRQPWRANHFALMAPDYTRAGSSLFFRCACLLLHVSDHRLS